MRYHYNVCDVAGVSNGVRQPRLIFFYRFQLSESNLFFIFSTFSGRSHANFPLFRPRKKKAGETPFGTASALRWHCVDTTAALRRHSVGTSYGLHRHCVGTASALRGLCFGTATAQSARRQICGNEVAFALRIDHRRNEKETDAHTHAI